MIKMYAGIDKDDGCKSLFAVKGDEIACSHDFGKADAWRDKRKFYSMLDKDRVLFSPAAFYAASVEDAELIWEG